MSTLVHIVIPKGYIITYNATRGGKLEVFERVDFDSLFTDGTKEGESNEDGGIGAD